jgi:hypothetical protein
VGVALAPEIALDDIEFVTVTSNTVASTHVPGSKTCVTDSVSETVMVRRSGSKTSATQHGNADSPKGTRRTTTRRSPLIGPG